MRSFATLATIYAATVGTTSATIPVTRPVQPNAVASGSSNGFVPENTLDGSTNANSRWSCQGGILDSSDEDEGCWIRYDFLVRQDIRTMGIAFHRGDENTRTLDVYENGEFHSKIKSSGSTLGYQSFNLYTQDTNDIMLRLADYEWNSDVWLGITEVKFI